MAAIKLFTTLLRFIDTEYYRDIESASRGLEMAFGGIVAMMYIIDMLEYTVIDDCRGIGGEYSYVKKRTIDNVK